MSRLTIFFPPHWFLWECHAWMSARDLDWMKGSYRTRVSRVVIHPGTGKRIPLIAHSVTWWRGNWGGV